MSIESELKNLPDLRRLAITRTFDAALKEAGLSAAVVAVVEDKKRGLVAQLVASTPVDDARVAEVLAGGLSTTERDMRVQRARQAATSLLTEWSAEEIYLSLPRPGGDAWLSIDRETGAVEYESTSRGAVSYLNDLHKGRNAGPAWGWFLDVFAVACLVFCITGLFLLHLHARQRRMTWPLVGLGLMIPLLIALLLIH